MTRSAPLPLAQALMFTRTLTYGQAKSKDKFAPKTGKKKLFNLATTKVLLQEVKEELRLLMGEK